MRTLFIAVGRVFGLLQVYYGLAYVTSMLPALSIMQRESANTAALTAGSMIATLVLTFSVAWLLLFRAEWLADRLKLPEHDAQSPLSADAVLFVGAKLLGLFVIIQAGPDLIGKLGRTISGIQEIVSLRDSMGSGLIERAMLDGIWSSLVAPALKLAFGLVLVLKTDAVLNWIDRKKHTTKKVSHDSQQHSAPLKTCVGIVKMKRITLSVLTCVAALLLPGYGDGFENFGDPLHNAAYRGDIATVRDLLERQSVPVDRRTGFGHYTALVLAGYTPHTNIVALLLKNGADVNAQDNGGMSALHCATYKGQTETARLLIQHGADLSLTNSYGFTPLREAVGKGPPELVALLLDSGASTSVRDQQRWQPLHAALRSNALSVDARLDIVRELLEHGADPNFVNVGGWEDHSSHDSHIGYRPPGNLNRGNSPLAIAKSNGFTNIVELLKDKGARE